jgi:tetratricopeptide (TPR) repeat protein
MVYTEWRSYDLAVKDYNRAIQLDPDMLAAYNNRGVVYTAIQEYDKAAADFDKVLELDAEYIPGYNNRAVSTPSRANQRPSPRWKPGIFQTTALTPTRWIGFSAAHRVRRAGRRACPAGHHYSARFFPELSHRQQAASSRTSASRPAGRWSRASLNAPGYRTWSLPVDRAEAQPGRPPSQGMQCCLFGTYRPAGRRGRAVDPKRTRCLATVSQRQRRT